MASYTKILCHNYVLPLSVHSLHFVGPIYMYMYVLLMQITCIKCCLKQVAKVTKYMYENVHNLHMNIAKERI